MVNLDSHYLYYNCLNMFVMRWSMSAYSSMAHCTSFSINFGHSTSKVVTFLCLRRVESRRSEVKVRAEVTLSCWATFGGCEVVEKRCRPIRFLGSTQTLLCSCMYTHLVTPSDHHILGKGLTSVTTYIYVCMHACTS